MLTALELAAMQGETRAHAFDGDAVRNDKSLSERVGLSRLGAHVVSIEPGCRASARHRHLFAEECVWVLSGSGRALIGDQVFAVRAGDFLGYPARGPAHALEAVGDAPLVCLVVGERLAQDVIDYPDAGKRLVRDNDDGTLHIRCHPSTTGLKPIE
ncbi:MAG: cupin domain-containing protein [Casimicrobiaceae bacterium]